MLDITDGTFATWRSARVAPDSEFGSIYAPRKDYAPGRDIDLDLTSRHRFRVAIASHRKLIGSALGGKAAAQAQRPDRAMVNSAKLAPICALHNSAHDRSLPSPDLPAERKCRSARRMGLIRPGLTGHMDWCLARLSRRHRTRVDLRSELNRLEPQVPARVAGFGKTNTFDRTGKRGRPRRPVPCFTGACHDPEGMTSPWI